jgi:hypothetical protein
MKKVFKGSVDLPFVFHIKKAKVDKQTYQETLDKNINMININPTTIPQIDKAFKDLCDIIVKTTEEIVPKRKMVRNVCYNI